MTGGSRRTEQQNLALFLEPSSILVYLLVDLLRVRLRDSLILRGRAVAHSSVDVESRASKADLGRLQRRVSENENYRAQR
jgi:hypothetical protein